MIPILENPRNPFSLPRGAGSEDDLRVRVSAAFVLSAAVLSLSAILLPREWSETRTRTRVSTVTILPYLDLIPLVNADGGGYGSPPGPPDLPALRSYANAVPVKEPLPDTSRSVPAAGTGGDGTEGGMGFGIGSGPGTGSGFGSGPGIGMDVQPVPVWEVFPEYPEAARKRKARGRIELEVRVNDRGQVDSVAVTHNETGDPALEAAAVRAARESRYLPVEINGRTVACRFRRSYRFEGD
ncbi:MAG: TonB family protein [bacterium]|nr:TonB family protein [bacterium]